MTNAEQRKLAYTEALAQLRLHPSLIWTRNNFFLLINSGLFAFSVSESGKDWSGFPLLVPLAGIFLSSIWLWVNIAGQRLQRHWRTLVVAIEQDLFKPSAGETNVEGPFTRASRVAREGTSWLVSINTALVILASGFILCWGYFLVRAWCIVNGAS